MLKKIAAAYLFRLRIIMIIAAITAIIIMRNEELYADNNCLIKYFTITKLST